ncbi:MAG: TIGR01777 family oxidoreductase [Anaerolineales bacterium]
MKILIAGSSGMIGSAVVPYLVSQVHEIIRLVRHEAGAGEVFWDPDAGKIDSAGLEGFDGVINLATMQWPGRWTTSAKQKIRANRLATNGLLAENLAKCNKKPKILICSSGMGIYPSSGDQVITEDSAIGSDFLATLQRDGEAAAMKASGAGIRVVNLRTPAVLGGEAIQRNIGRIGDGKQWSPWISRDELASIIGYVLITETIIGPLNPVSPNTLRNSEYTETASRVMGRKPGASIPAFLLRLMIGEMADALLLASRRIEPKKLLDNGYQFRFPALEDALRHELAVSG